MKLFKFRFLNKINKFLSRTEKEIEKGQKKFFFQLVQARKTFQKTFRSFFSRNKKSFQKGLSLAVKILVILLIGFIGGTLGGIYFYFQGQTFLYDLQKEILEHKPPQITKITNQTIYLPQTSQEEAIIKVVKEASPAVVTIVITKEVPVYEQYLEPFGGGFFKIEIPQFRQKGTKKEKVGSGSGFIISPDGLILTNKHVVYDESAEYSVVTSEGKVYRAKVLAKDPFQDLAIVKIERERTINQEGDFQEKDFPYLKLGDSDKIQIGQIVIAIGNPLGQFQNTVSVGVISGLGRSITASGGGLTETIEDVIQTDAAINKGNSGGPLLNLKGEVIGINTAMVEGAQNLGFAVPINKAKRDLEQFQKLGKIVYPFLGIRYIMITPEIKEERNLSVDYGALIVRGTGPNEMAIIPGSAAEKAGLKENDIILEVNGEKVNQNNKLSKLIQKYNPGDTIKLKVMRNGEIKYFNAKLGEKTG